MIIMLNNVNHNRLSNRPRFSLLRLTVYTSVKQGRWAGGSFFKTFVVTIHVLPVSLILPLSIVFQTIGWYSSGRVDS